MRDAGTLRCLIVGTGPSAAPGIPAALGSHIPDNPATVQKSSKRGTGMTPKQRVLTAAKLDSSRAK